MGATGARKGSDSVSSSSIIGYADHNIFTFKGEESMVEYVYRTLNWSKLEIPISDSTTTSPQYNFFTNGGRDYSEIVDLLQSTTPENFSSLILSDLDLIPYYELSCFHKLHSFIEISGRELLRLFDRLFPFSPKSFLHSLKAFPFSRNMLLTFLASRLPECSIWDLSEVDVADQLQIYSRHFFIYQLIIQKEFFHDAVSSESRVVHDENVISIPLEIRLPTDGRVIRMMKCLFLRSDLKSSVKSELQSSNHTATSDMYYTADFRIALNAIQYIIGTNFEMKYLARSAHEAIEWLRWIREADYGGLKHTGCILTHKQSCEESLSTLLNNTVNDNNNKIELRKRIKIPLIDNTSNIPSNKSELIHPHNAKFEHEQRYDKQRHIKKSRVKNNSARMTLSGTTVPSSFFDLIIQLKSFCLKKIGHELPIIKESTIHLDDDLVLIIEILKEHDLGVIHEDIVADFIFRLILSLLHRFFISSSNDSFNLNTNSNHLMNYDIVQHCSTLLETIRWSFVTPDAVTAIQSAFHLIEKNCTSQITSLIQSKHFLNEEHMDMMTCHPMSVRYSFIAATVKHIMSFIQQFNATSTSQLSGTLGHHVDNYSPRRYFLSKLGILEYIQIYGKRLQTTWDIEHHPFKQSVCVRPLISSSLPVSKRRKGDHPKQVTIASDIVLRRPREVPIQVRTLLTHEGGVKQGECCIFECEFLWKGTRCSIGSHPLIGVVSSEGCLPGLPYGNVEQIAGHFGWAIDIETASVGMSYTPLINQNDNKDVLSSSPSSQPLLYRRSLRLRSSRPQFSDNYLSVIPSTMSSFRVPISTKKHPSHLYSSQDESMLKKNDSDSHLNYLHHTLLNHRDVCTTRHDHSLIYHTAVTESPPLLSFKSVSMILPLRIMIDRKKNRIVAFVPQSSQHNYFEQYIPQLHLIQGPIYPAVSLSSGGFRGYFQNVHPEFLLSSHDLLHTNTQNIVNTDQSSISLSVESSSYQTSLSLFNFSFLHSMYSPLLLPLNDSCCLAQYIQDKQYHSTHTSLPFISTIQRPNISSKTIQKRQSLPLQITRGGRKNGTSVSKRLSILRRQSINTQTIVPLHMTHRYVQPSQINKSTTSHSSIIPFNQMNHNITQTSSLYDEQQHYRFPFTQILIPSPIVSENQHKKSLPIISYPIYNQYANLTRVNKLHHCLKRPIIKKIKDNKYIPQNQQESSSTKLSENQNVNTQSNNCNETTNSSSLNIISNLTHKNNVYAHNINDTNNHTLLINRRLPRQEKINNFYSYNKNHTNHSYYELDNTQSDSDDEEEDDEIQHVLSRSRTKKVNTKSRTTPFTSSLNNNDDDDEWKPHRCHRKKKKGQVISASKYTVTPHSSTISTSPIKDNRLNNIDHATKKLIPFQDTTAVKKDLQPKRHKSSLTSPPLNSTNTKNSFKCTQLNNGHETTDISSIPLASPLQFNSVSLSPSTITKNKKMLFQMKTKKSLTRKPLPVTAVLKLSITANNIQRNCYTNTSSSTASPGKQNRSNHLKAPLVSPLPFSAAKLSTTVDPHVLANTVLHKRSKNKKHNNSFSKKTEKNSDSQQSVSLCKTTIN